MSLIELKKIPTKTISAYAEKTAKDQTIGLTLNYYDGGRILVRHVFDDGLFAESELKAGHLITHVNEADVKGMSTLQVMELFTDAEPGEINVLAEDIGLHVGSAMKETVDDKVGIGIKMYENDIIISTISDSSIFADSDIKVGQKLIGVNGTSCRGLNTVQAIVLFKELEGLTVMTEETTFITDKVTKPSLDSKVGIGIRELGGNVIVSTIAPDGLFVDTKIKPGLRLVYVNKTDCTKASRMEVIKTFKEAEGSITVVAEDVGYVTTTVTKESPDAKLGVAVKELNGHIIISSINEGSLFEDTDLMPGLRMVMINGTQTKGMNKSEAIDLLKNAESEVTVLAEKVGLITCSAYKQSKESKVGIGLKTIKGRATISKIADDGLFAGSDLKVGHVLVSINKKDCQAMDKKEAIQLLKDADEGKLTIMVEETGLIGANVEKKSPDDKVGIGLKEVNGEVVISSIYENGLFTKSGLKDELRLVSVNDRSVKGLSRNEAIKLFREAEGSLVVMAEDMSVKSVIA